MVQAYGALFAWKLSLHGIDASSTRQWVGSKTSRPSTATATPGRPPVPGATSTRGSPRSGSSPRRPSRAGRSRARVRPRLHRPSGPRGAAGQRRPGLHHPDRRADPVRRRRRTPPLAPADRDVASPDLTGDGRATLPGTRPASLRVLPRRRLRRLRCPARSADHVPNHDLLTAVGDLNGDGRNDLVGAAGRRRPARLYLGGGTAASRPAALGPGWGGDNAIAATGDLDGDGRDDLLARDVDGRLWRSRRSAAGTLGRAGRGARRVGPLRHHGGYGDFTGDGRNDLLVPQGRRAAPSAGARRRQLRPARGGVRLDGGTTALSGGNLTGAGAPDLLAPQGHQPGDLPQRGTFETGAPDPHRCRPRRQRRGAERRRLGPGRLRRPGLPQTATGALYPAARRRSRRFGPRSGSPAASARSASWPRSAT